MLQEFLKSISEKEKAKFEEKVQIENCNFSKRAIHNLFVNYKKIKTKCFLKNSDFVLFESDTILIDNCTIENCYFFGSNIEIKNSVLNDVSVVACPLFFTNETTLTECYFQNGTKEVTQSNPIIFNFPGKGSILNPSSGKIDFFGFVNTYDYFLKRLDEFPYNKYSEELNSLILMGSR